jgi:acetamidase/formamidase
MLDIWNCPISQVVNGVKGTYCMVPKQVKTTKPAALPKQDNAKFFVTYAKDADLEKAMNSAAIAMIDGISEKKKLTRLDAYSLSSIAMDCRIGPHSTGDKEVHCMMPKSLWIRSK